MDARLQTAIARAAQDLAQSRSIVILTGAGISAESGLRTFRGTTGAEASDLPKDMQALWKEFDPMKLATPEAFDADPAMVSRWYDWRRMGCLAAEPNAGHLALALLESIMRERGGTFCLLTQNVDRLHQRAGSGNVVELHGSIIQWRCTHCDKRITPPNEPMTIFPPPSPWAGTDAPDDALLRPDVVWFGEMLPFEALQAADEAMASCDVFISIGTSAVVYPAAGYIQQAAHRGARTIEVNAEATAVSRLVDHTLRGKAGEVLPELLAQAFTEFDK